jgi:hypothetical protein
LDWTTIASTDMASPFTVGVADQSRGPLRAPVRPSVGL